MPNGKPGDHPITDVVVHGEEVFSPRVNALLRDVHRMGGHRDLEALESDLLAAEQLLGRLDVELVTLRESLGRRRSS